MFNENTKLFSSKIFKFKVVAPKDFTRKIEESTVSLEQTSGDKKTTMLVVRSAVKTLFVGVVDPSLSKIKRVVEKAAQNQLKIAVVFTETAKGPAQPAKKALTYCSINFVRFEDLAEFETAFKAVCGTK